MASVAKGGGGAPGSLKCGRLRQPLRLAAPHLLAYFIPLAMARLRGRPAIAFSNCLHCVLRCAGCKVGYDLTVERLVQAVHKGAPVPNERGLVLCYPSSPPDNRVHMFSVLCCRVCYVAQELFLSKNSSWQSSRCAAGARTTRSSVCGCLADKCLLDGLSLCVRPFAVSVLH